jgi:hypothetical protein
MVFVIVFMVVADVVWLTAVNLQHVLKKKTGV